MNGELLEAERVHSIVGAFFTVYNYYGYGLSEAIYAGALEYELIDRGREVVRELLVAVSDNGRHVGWQRVDMVVDSAVIVENKATIPQSDSCSFVQFASPSVGVHLGRRDLNPRYVSEFPNSSS